MQINSLKNKYKDEWLLIEVEEEDELHQPKEGKLIAHSKSKEEIIEISKKLKGDICILFAGEVPKKGYAFAFGCLNG